MKVLLGHATVDSGLLVIVDPCYVDEGLDYEAMCEVSINDPNQGGEFVAKGYANGVVTSTGVGDGNYPVYAEVVEEVGVWGKRITSVTVDFMDHPLL